MATAKDVALWMLQKLQTVKYLDQETTVHEIARTFGDSFTYTNNNGNLAIGKPVLREFKKLSGSNVVWERGERHWRLRQSYDAPGKRQQD